MCKENKSSTQTGIIKNNMKNMDADKTHYKPVGTLVHL